VAGSLNGEIVDLVGARNVVAGRGKGTFGPLSLDQLAGLAPDVIVTIDPAAFATMRSDPSWRRLTAVTDNHVYRAPAAPFGWIDEPPSVNRVIGLLWLAQKLYPAHFPDDMRCEAVRFYTLFYRRALRDSEIESLLTSP
jgi:iron complex transport system substrate-binding protein